MFSNYETNFYIRKDNDNILWSGLSVKIPKKIYVSYKLSCFFKKDNKGLWRPHEIEFIIFDKENNMYIINKYTLAQIYNLNAKNKKIPFVADVANPQEEYKNNETKQIYLNELFIKKYIDEFLAKVEQSFSIKIKI